MEIVGFVFLCGITFYFSVLNIINLIAGGGDLCPLLTGWVDWKIKVLGIILIILNIYIWYLLFFVLSPFTIGLK